MSAGDARKRQAEGKALTVRDQAALRRDTDRRLEEQFETLATTVSQKALCEMLDTSRKIVLEWGRAGMPRNADRKKTYNLFVVMPWLRSRWNKFPDDWEMVGDDEHTLKWKKFRARMSELVVLEKEEELIPRARCREGLLRLAGLLRAMGARLQRAYGPHAQEMLNETLDEFQGVVLTEFSPGRRRRASTTPPAPPAKKKSEKKPKKKSKKKTKAKPKKKQGAPGRKPRASRGRAVAAATAKKKAKRKSKKKKSKKSKPKKGK